MSGSAAVNRCFGSVRAQVWQVGPMRVINCLQPVAALIAILRAVEVISTARLASYHLHHYLRASQFLDFEFVNFILTRK